MNATSCTLPADLLLRELRGPRYTSYPTALAFGPDFSIADYVVALRRCARGVGPLSLYLHVPFCASNCYYCGCHRVVSRNPERIQRYLLALLNEIRMQSALIGAGPEVVQIHLGGGTPNSFSLHQLMQLVRALRHHFRLAEGDRLELSMEADPRLAEVGDLHAWRALGFNRLSFGVQDVNPDVQQAINRVQSSEHLETLTAAARRAGFTSLNYDLVYGLPRQTEASFEATLDFVIAQRPERIAAYHYAHLPERFRAQRVIDAGQLPSARTRQRLRERVHQRLTAAGYCAIGLDHYALPQDALARAYRNGTLRRNFQGYATEAGSDLLGLGVSAISHLGPAFAQNHAGLAQYLDAVEHDRLPLARGYWQTADDRLRADLIESIMCRGEVDFGALGARHGVDAARVFTEELQRLAELDPEQRWLHSGPWGLRVEEQGRALLRVVAMVFDRHLRDAEASRYSRVA